MLPVSLEVFNLGDHRQNTNKFTGGIPSEWGALTNLKELQMVACDLDGKPLSIRTELHDRRAYDLTFFCTGAIPVELGMLVNLKELWLIHNQLTGALSIRPTT